MKQITIAKSAGFCFGVDRAVRMTYEALEQYPHVATLGPIIHNQTVVDDLCQKGARIVEDVSELEPEECIVIRSHGVSKQVEDAIAAAGNPCINATCPFVSKIHKIVEKHTLARLYFDCRRQKPSGSAGDCRTLRRKLHRFCRFRSPRPFF